MECLTLKAKALWSFEMLELPSQQHSITCIFSNTAVETSNFMHNLDNDMVLRIKIEFGSSEWAV
jgi:hypothetical protein